MKNKTSLLLSFCALLVSISSLVIVLNKSQERSKRDARKEVLSVASEHSEELMQAIKNGIEKKEAKKRKLALEKLMASNADLFNTNTPYFMGNPNGSVIFVEFIDYNCGFCKRAYEIVKEVIKDHPEVKVLLKEFPILGPSSELSAKVALASAKQGKYQETNKALIFNKTPLRNNDDVRKFAKTLGLNPDQLLKDMEDPTIEKTLKKNVEMALAVGVQGTPGFISKDNVFPGMITKDQFAKLVREELEKNK